VLYHCYDYVKNAAVLDDPGRREFLDPEAILDMIHLDNNTVFVDIGAGSGYFALPAAASVKQVLALDILDEMLEVIKRGTADVVFMSNVFHELNDHALALEEVMRILNRDGIMAVVDWKKKSTPVGPPVDHRFSELDVTEILQLCGFELIEIRDAGPYHYLIVCSRPPE
jgi:ubiquinone/menaquinone biosynthesis C-methylase UbiE